MNEALQAQALAILTAVQAESRQLVIGPREGGWFVRVRLPHGEHVFHGVSATDALAQYAQWSLSVRE